MTNTALVLDNTPGDAMMAAMRSVMWENPAEVGLERCFLTALGGRSGHVLGGTALLTTGDAPCEVRYHVQVDEAWRTRHVKVERLGPADDGGILLNVEMQPSQGGFHEVRWHVDGAHQAELDGCVDVDLEFTPSTNTLPVRRLGLEVGEGADVNVAWVRFPVLRVERAQQRYTRIASSCYEFRTGGFIAELSVDAAGLVARYGDAWRQVASQER